MATNMWGTCALVAVLIVGCTASCYEQTDCKACTEHTGYFFLACKWCPLSNLCHTTGSVYNDCHEHVSVTEPAKCIPEDPEPYNKTLASQLAVWAAMAYVPPTEIDPQALAIYLMKSVPGEYRMLKYLSKQCDLMSNYSACAVLVAISDREENIIVSFEGTQNLDQLYEQLLAAALAGMEKTSVGGEVLYYNENLQQLIYPCLKEYLIDILSENPTYSLTITGHSLGGAQAQLTAATLIKDKVITNNRLLVYTFGAPRFGDRDFAAYFDLLVKTNWRVVQAKDPVPRIPPSYYLYHTHGEVWYSSPGVTVNSPYTICSANEDVNCAWSQPAICFTKDCVRVHELYFSKNLASRYVDMKELKGPNKPRVAKQGTCQSVSFSEK